MPLRSMTGFGSAAREWVAGDGPVRVEVEIRSVNARFLELKLKQPFGPRVEQALRQHTAARLGRGRVELSVHLRSPSAREDAHEGKPDDVLGSFGFDARRVRAAMRLLSQIERTAAEEELELKRSTSAELLRFIQGTTRGGAPESTPDPPPFLEALVQTALEELCQFRAREGDALHAALDALVDTLATQVAEVEATLAPEEARLTERWVSRVGEVCERAGVTAALEPDRVVQEVAVLVARGDVAEELARIRSHVDQLREVLSAEPAVGQGKTLDFLSQELLREITTIGSKITSHTGSRIVIDAKGTIERVREQVQNVE
jgi:uncharacterized protein YicC (UPF0701 family)